VEPIYVVGFAALIAGFVVGWIRLRRGNGSQPQVATRQLFLFVLVGVLSVAFVAWSLGGIGAGIFGGTLALIGGVWTVWRLRRDERARSR
jgi:hypothetical protein